MIWRCLSLTRGMHSHHHKCTRARFDTRYATTRNSLHKYSLLNHYINLILNNYHWNDNLMRTLKTKGKQRL